MQEEQKAAGATVQPQVWQAAVPAQPSQAPVAKADPDGISWTASEFIAHTKSAGWYGLLGVASVIVAALVYLATRDKITSGMVVVVAIAFGLMAARKPRDLTYIVDDQGISVGGKLYPYEKFKSFSVVQEEGVESIWFMPMQRFNQGLSIYFAPDDGDKIVDLLAEFLPFEPKDQDMMDRLMHRIRF